MFKVVLATGLLTALPLSSLATSASSASVHADEPRCCTYYVGDTSGRDAGVFGADIHYTTLSTVTPGTFVIKIKGYEFLTDRLNQVNVFLDVSQRNAGPEYDFGYLFTLNQDGYSGRYLAKIDTWSDAGHSIPCPKWTTTVNYFTDVITLTIPRRCVGSPAHVRWNAETWRITTRAPSDPKGYEDSAPDHHNFDFAWTGYPGD